MFVSDFLGVLGNKGLFLVMKCDVVPEGRGRLSHRKVKRFLGEELIKSKKLFLFLEVLLVEVKGVEFSVVLRRVANLEESVGLVVVG